VTIVSGYDRYTFAVEVDGVGEAFADTQAEAVALAFRLRSTFGRRRLPGQARPIVFVVDNWAHELVLGWWLLPEADLNDE
jgi:hypothetical protein